MKETLLPLCLFMASLLTYAQVPSEVAAVDLGLPSGTKWATMNVGAYKSDESGERVAFGELEPKSVYNENSYLHYDGIAYNHWASYLSRIEGSAYDVAHVKWGGKWRMPTVDEVNELIAKCTRRIVNGCLEFTGPNGNNILFPWNSVGYWTATAERNDPLHNGGYVYYSGSSYSYLKNNYADPTLSDWTQGLYVRPVLNENTPVSEVPLIEMHEEVDFNLVDTANVIVKLSKTFRSGWNTLVLPFNPGILLANYYNNPRVFEFKGFENGVLLFRTATQLKENTPYLVYYNGQTQHLTKYFSHWGYKGSGSGAAYRMKIKNGPTDVTYGDCGFIGTYHNLEMSKENITENDYILDGRTFRKVTPSDKLRSYSAYIKLNIAGSMQSDTLLRISIDGEMLDPRIILQENGTTVPPNESNVDVQVVKSLRRNRWTPICLPFAMSASQIKRALGNDVELADLASWTLSDGIDSEVFINMNFNSGLSTLESSHPYMIKTSKDVSYFDVDKVSINTNTYPVVEMMDESGRNFALFHGTYVTEPIWHSLYIQNGSPYMLKDDEETMALAYGGYFRFFLENEPPVEKMIFRLLLGDNEVTTSIQEVSYPSSTGFFYNVHGQKVESPSKGVFIKNGKKYIYR